MNEAELDIIDKNMEAMMDVVGKKGQQGLIAYYIEQDNGEFTWQVVTTDNLHPSDAMDAIGEWAVTLSSDIRDQEDAPPFNMVK